MKSYKRLLAGLAAVAVYSNTLWAADDPLRIMPKEMPIQKKPATLLPEPPPSPAGQALADNPMIADPLKGVVIVSDKKDLRLGGAEPVSGLVVKNIPLLKHRDFANVVKSYIGKPMRMKELKQLQKDIVLYCRKHRRPVVDVILPEQDLSNGVLQMWFVEGKTGKVTVDNLGVKWFSDNSIKEQVRLRPGEPVNSKTLLDDVNWLNRNPFRQVDVRLQQGAQLGESDIGLHVEDRFPVRFYIGYEDSGNMMTGQDRLMTGFNWGNAFGVGHQFNYQYTTDTGLDFLESHSAAYIIPLPWRHTISIYASRAEGTADFPPTMSGFSQDIENTQGSIRYEMPLISIGKFTHQLTVGFDFKKSNSGLLFGQESLSESSSEILQFQAGYNCAMPDPFGQTRLNFEVYYSPGNLTARNTDAEFALLRYGAPAGYSFGRATLERITRLPWDFSWTITASAQGSDDRLMPSEQLGLGGWQTVRGYDEREINGDKGGFFSTELRTPPISLISPVVGWITGDEGKKETGARKGFWMNDQFQILGFFDAGYTYINDAQPGELYRQRMASWGVGCRYTINPYLSLRFDYGFQMHKSGAAEQQPDFDFSEGSRGHIGVLVSY